MILSQRIGASRSYAELGLPIYLGFVRLGTGIIDGDVILFTGMFDGLAETATIGIGIAEKQPVAAGTTQGFCVSEAAAQRK